MQYSIVDILRLQTLVLMLINLQYLVKFIGRMDLQYE